MKRSLLVPVLLGLAVMVVSVTPAMAQHLAGCGCYCGKVIRPPCSDDACKQACGWSAPSTGSNQPSDNSAAEAEAEHQRQQEAERQRQLEAERQRQREIEEQRKRDEEEARRRQAEFERKKQEALSSMKGIAENELGLKDAGAGDLGLKDIGDTGGSGLGLREGPAPPAAPVTSTQKQPDCQWGDQGSSLVDLRCLGLDPDKPIVLDPHIARGQERAFPAQIDPATFQNAAYNKGFEALMRFDVASAQAAVEYFKQAQLERPNDPLVRNALLLAQDILKARQQREQEDKAKAMQSLYHGVAALMMGDVRTASASVERAQKLDPQNSAIGPWSRLMSGLFEHYKEAPAGNRVVCELVGNALIFESRGEFKHEIVTLEEAAHVAPNDTYVQGMLWRARHLKPENPGFSSVAPGAATRYPAGAGGLKPGNPASSSAAPAPK
ncbi:MAG: hypothetical protein ABSD27_00295 [Bryobacteraceae bacterium]